MTLSPPKESKVPAHRGLLCVWSALCLLLGNAVAFERGKARRHENCSSKRAANGRRLILTLSNHPGNVFSFQSAIPSKFNVCSSRELLINWAYALMLTLNGTLWLQIPPPTVIYRLGRVTHSHFTEDKPKWIWCSSEFWYCAVLICGSQLNFWRSFGCFPVKSSCIIRFLFTEWNI